MKIEKIKITVSIISFIAIVIIGLFFSKGSEEVFADFLAESYKCIIVEKPIESTTNKGLYVYKGTQLNTNNKTSVFGINSRLFHKIISIGDTTEKIKNTGIFIIKKKKLIIKLTLIYTKKDNLDTLLVR
jgi:hypothetical protein